MAWPSSRYKTASNGGSWTPADMNGVQDQYIRSAGVEADDLEQAVTEALGITTSASGHGGAAARRGNCIVPTEESRTNTAYGTLTTSDIVEDIVLPTDGLIVVLYSAMWKESVAGAARAALFVGANQLKASAFGVAGGPQVQAAATQAGGGVTNSYTPLATVPVGLASGEINPGSAIDVPVTTGQAVGAMGSNTASFYVGSVNWKETMPVGSPCFIFAAAGTYDISVQFKASSGSVTAKERKLWVWSIGF